MNLDRKIKITVIVPIKDSKSKFPCCKNEFDDLFGNE
jgi:hypothetical protein